MAHPSVRSLSGKGKRGKGDYGLVIKKSFQTQESQNRAEREKQDYPKPTVL
ncbi:hypothetical protein [Pedobacter psychrophilus]|uniref:hypothetical protein n=1 Tax=Pedobacter psychrophilus TaxID=1826909 RepID=UPI000ACF47AC|nr:hypothetical protein [Pedobacter psychrophilus]